MAEQFIEGRAVEWLAEVGKPQIEPADEVDSLAATQPHQSVRDEQADGGEVMPAWAADMMRELTEQNQQLQNLVEAQGRRIDDLEARIGVLEQSRAATGPAAGAAAGGRLRGAGQWVREASGRAWEATGGRLAAWVRGRFGGVSGDNFRSRAGGVLAEANRRVTAEGRIPWQSALVVGTSLARRGALEAGVLAGAGAAAAPVAAGLAALGADGVRALAGGRRALYESAAQHIHAGRIGAGTESEQERERNRWRGHGVMGFAYGLLRRLGIGANLLRNSGVQVAMGVTRDRSRVSQVLDRLAIADFTMFNQDEFEDAVNAWLGLNISQGNDGEILGAGRALARLRALGVRQGGSPNEYDYGDADVYGLTGSYNPDSRVHRGLRRIPLVGRLFNRMMHEVNPNHNGRLLQRFHEYLNRVVSGLDDQNPTHRRLKEEWSRTAGLELGRMERFSQVAPAVIAGAAGTMATAGLALLPQLWQQGVETIAGGARNVAGAELENLRQELQGPAGSEGPEGPAGPPAREAGGGGAEAGDGGQLPVPAGEAMIRSLDGQTLFDYARGVVEKANQTALAGGADAAGLVDTGAGADVVKDVVDAVNRAAGHEVNWNAIGPAAQFTVLRGVDTAVTLKEGTSGLMLSNEAMANLANGLGEALRLNAGGQNLTNAQQWLLNLNYGTETGQSLANNSQVLNEILGIANG